VDASYPPFREPPYVNTVEPRLLSKGLATILYLMSISSFLLLIHGILAIADIIHGLLL